MTRTRVKICGLTGPEDRDAAVAAGADAVGVISDVPVDTPREVAAETAASLVEGVPPMVTSVLVTMPSSVQATVDRQAQVGADAIQIHGSLSPQKLGGLAARVDAAVIAAVDATEESIEEYAAAADALLVDSTDEEGGGGTGETHDWTRTREIVERVDVPVILAGGLTPENVREAVGTVEPFAVDTASGVEASGGQKDHDAIERFVAATETDRQQTDAASAQQAGEGNG